MIENSLWAERYRPQTIDEYVGNEEFIEKVRHWIETGDVPNLILYSEKSGTGKTSCCKLLAKALDADVMYLNASDENSIDTVREKIKSFATSMGFKKWKIIILDEFSFFSIQAQSALNNVIESTSLHTRFFLTGNYIEKFLPSIVSRCNPYLIQSPPPKEIFKNISGILTQEGIEFDPQDLVKIIKQHYPDQRSMLNYCQNNSNTGKLVYSTLNLSVSDWMTKVLDELKSGKDPKTTFTAIRQIIADSRVRTFDDLYRFLFDNLDEFAGEGKKAMCILHIAESQYRANFAVDKEIEASALFINLLKDLK